MVCAQTSGSEGGGGGLQGNAQFTKPQLLVQRAMVICTTLLGHFLRLFRCLPIVLVFFPRLGHSIGSDKSDGSLAKLGLFFVRVHIREARAVRFRWSPDDKSVRRLLNAHAISRKIKITTFCHVRRPGNRPLSGVYVWVFLSMDRPCSAVSETKTRK